MKSEEKQEREADAAMRRLGDSDGFEGRPAQHPLTYRAVIGGGYRSTPYGEGYGRGWIHRNPDREWSPEEIEAAEQLREQQDEYRRLGLPFGHPEPDKIRK